MTTHPDFDFTGSDIDNAQFAKDHEALNAYQHQTVVTIVKRVDYDISSGKFWLDSSTEMDFNEMVALFKLHWSQDHYVRAALGFVRAEAQADRYRVEAASLRKLALRGKGTHTCWLCGRACEPHAFYLASDNETAQAICEPCGEENTTDTCGCCGAKGDSVEINELIEITDDRFPAQTYIAMCSKCEVESDRLSRELDQETP